MSPSRGEFYIPTLILNICTFINSCSGQTGYAEPDTCGTRFIIPYLSESIKCDVSIEVVPQLLNATHINLTSTYTNSYFNASYEIAPNSSLVIELNFPRIRLQDAMLEEDKAVALLLMATGDVCVMYGRQEGDRSQLYPTDTFGTDYVIMSPSTTINVSSTVYILPQGIPNTLTNVTLTVNSNSSLCDLLLCGIGDTEFNFTIRANEMLALDDGNLMDGVKISASRPVGVLVAGISSFDPENGTLCLEPQISTSEMLTPVNTWGKMFVAVPLTPEILVTLKITGETNVTVTLENTVASYTVKDSDALQLNFINESYIMLKSVKPIQVMYITNVTSYDQKTMFKNDFILPPLEQYIGYQAFSLKKQHNASSLVAVSPSTLGDEPSSQMFLDYYTNETATRVYKLTQENVTVTRVGNLQGTYHSIMDIKINTSYGMIYDADRSSFSVLGMRLTTLNKQCQSLNISSFNISENGISKQSNCNEQVLSDGNETISAFEESGSLLSSQSVLVKNEDSLKMPSRFSVKGSKDTHHITDTSLSSNIVAVIVSLSVALFAVCVVIASFVLIELITRRKQLRSTKIRPFVS
ncbi:uncharacterized protein LOC115213987 [Argonauta hians]